MTLSLLWHLSCLRQQMNVLSSKLMCWKEKKEGAWGFLTGANLWWLDQSIKLQLSFRSTVRVIYEESSEEGSPEAREREERRPLMETAFPIGWGLFQQENRSWNRAGMAVEECEELHYWLIGPQNYPDLNPMKPLWEVLDRSNPWRPHLTNEKNCCLQPGARYHSTASGVCGCFWQQREDQHNILQLVTLKCLIDSAAVKNMDSIFPLWHWNEIEVYLGLFFWPSSHLYSSGPPGKWILQLICWHVQRTGGECLHQICLKTLVVVQMVVVQIVVERDVNRWMGQKISACHNKTCQISSAPPLEDTVTVI